MRVKLGPNTHVGGRGYPGQTVDLPRALADQLIEAGRAEAVGGSEREQTNSPQSTDTVTLPSADLLKKEIVAELKRMGHEVDERKTKDEIIEEFGLV